MAETIKRWDALMHNPLVAHYHAKKMTDPEIAAAINERCATEFMPSTITKRRQDMKLPRNTKPKVRTPREKKKPIDCDLLSIMSLMKAVSYRLGKRYEERITGLWLDGRPSNLTLVMQAFNRTRQDDELPQIVLNPEWRAS